MGGGQDTRLRRPGSMRSGGEVPQRREGKMSTTVRLQVTVNGVRHESEVEPRLLLVQYLRDALGLTGTHVGCDTTNCGACTVHVNGEAVKSCTVLAVQTDGAEVTTIEGLAQDG